jgi:hypothetical protein
MGKEKIKAMQEKLKQRVALMRGSRKPEWTLDCLLTQ